MLDLQIVKERRALVTQPPGVAGGKSPRGGAATGTEATGAAAGIAIERLAKDDFLRSLVETIPDAMVVTDSDGRILSFSRAAEAMFGYREIELAGENVSVLMPSPDRENHDRHMRRYLETGERHIIGIGRVTTARRRSGDSFPIDLSVGEAMIDGRRVFTGFIRDLSEREEVRRRLHILQAELAHVSRISSMGMLASAIAHELNQPLTAIANYTETVHAMIAAGRDDRDAIQESMQHCTEEVMRAGEIIRRLREFMAHGDVERGRASMQDLIGEAIALALADGEGIGVALSFDYDAVADTVFADRVQIQQVVLNLVRNAMEAMLGQPSRSIDIRTRLYGADMAEIIVSDSGPGIEPHIAARLFQPFQSTKPSGMGIGLSICHTIVDGHGGRIWVEPSMLGGTAFHFTLPLMKAQPQPVETGA